MDDLINQLYFLFRGAIQPVDILTDHISVDACRPDCQLMSALFCFRIMNDHMDRSTFPCDTTHLPGISVYEREVVRYSSGDCFLFLHHQIKFDVIIYRRNVLKLLCDTILSGSLQKLIERSLSIKIDLLYELFEGFLEEEASQDFDFDNGLVCR